MKKLLLASLLAAALGTIGADAEGLARYALSNGLELYVLRDASTPLARMQLAFKAGGIAQSAETAGRFRLLERSLLRQSDQGLPSPVAVSLAGLGATALDGGTYADGMSYWFTIPSSLLAQGLGFWATAFAGSAAQVVEVEAAIGESLAAASDPAAIFRAALDKRLFPKYPWRLDLLGSEQTLRGATAPSLEALRSLWLVPANAALFVGGDVDPETVRAEAERAFSKWKAAPDPWNKPLAPQAKPGVARPTWIVYPDPSLPEGLGAVEARYRGPDPAADPAASMAARLWSALAADPAGRFKAALTKDLPGLQGAGSIAAAYVARRDSSYLAVGAYFVVDPASPSADRARLFKERVRGFELTAMKADPARYFGPAEIEAAKARLLREREAATDDAEGAIAALAEDWLVSSVDQNLGFAAALAKTGAAELAAFLDSYFMKNLEVVSLRMNPVDHERERKSLANSGFELVTASNAFWWKK